MASSWRSRTLGILGWLAVALGLGVLAVGLWWLIRVDAVRWVVLGNRWLAENVVARMGYLGVFILMVIESSFIPVPSEIVIPPAGDLARRLPDWELGWVILVGVLGSLVGALINYYLALYVGRPVLLRLINRFGGYLRITEQGYLAAEGMFHRHGAIATFSGRLLPGIRHLISLPAGLARMHLLSFCLLTSLGAGIWVAILGLAGYWFGSDPDLLAASLQYYSHWIVAGVLIVVGGYVVVYRLRHRPQR